MNYEDNTKNVMMESDTEFVIEKSIVYKWNTTIGDQKQHKLFLEPSIYITSVDSNVQLMKKTRQMRNFSKEI